MAREVHEAEHRGPAGVKIGQFRYMGYYGQHLDPRLLALRNGHDPVRPFRVSIRALAVGPEEGFGRSVSSAAACMIWPDWQ
jgi:hypothetical protein